MLKAIVERLLRAAMSATGVSRGSFIELAAEVQQMADQTVEAAATAATLKVAPFTPYGRATQPAAAARKPRPAARLKVVK